LSNSAHSRGIRVLAVAKEQSNETMRAWLDAGADGVILSDLKAIPALLSSGQP
jgi:DNA-binding NarL/FixJ family response regulator